jgi:ATP-binding cassette subfamily C protein
MVIVSMVLLTGVLSMATPLVTEQVMSKVIPEAQYGQLLIFGIALIVIALSSTISSLVQSIAVLRIEGVMDNRLQSSVWDRLLRLPSSFFRKFTVGDLLSRASGIDGIRQLLTSSAVSSVIAAVTGMFSLALMFYYDAILASVVASFSIVVGGFSYLMGLKAVARQREYLERQADISTDVFQYLNGISKLRVSGAESEAFVLWARKYAQAELVGIDQQGMTNAVAVANTVFTYIAIAAVLAVIGMQGHQLFAFFSVPKSWHSIDTATLTHVMPAAVFIAFNAAYGQFSTAVTQLAQQGIALSMMKPLYDRLRPVLEAEEENSQAAMDPGELSGSIHIHDVHFRYSKDGPPVLQGLSMQVEPGSFVALVGPSGAGKSSLLRLLLVFDTPESGSIFLDGNDITQLDAQALRRNFGVVLQNGQLFAGSIFDNITAGSNLNMDDAWWAARMSGLDKDIETMPMGMQTVLSEGAGTLSGGQRQRLMIARAIVHRPRVLIFDEATSALDNETQAIVSKSLESLNCTRIAIAHRLSTIRQADSIFVVVAGRVVESGNYASLMEQQGVFFDLAQRQIA